MRQILNNICPKIVPKFKLKFEGLILEIFGDLGAETEQLRKYFQISIRVGGARASSEREGKA